MPFDASEFLRLHLERIARKEKKRSPKLSPEQEEEQWLMEKIRLFTQGQQVVVDTYRPKMQEDNIDKSIIDLGQFKEGTIFRIVANTDIDEKQHVIYAWYIIGKEDSQGHSTVYQIKYSDLSLEADYMVDNPILKLHPSLKLQKLNPPRTKFGVMVASKVMHGMNIPDDNSVIGPSDHYFPEKKIEVMNSGVARKVTRPTPIRPAVSSPSRGPSLNPQPLRPEPVPA